MAETSLSICNSSLIHGSRKPMSWCASLLPSFEHKTHDQPITLKRKQSYHGWRIKWLSHRSFVFAVTKGSSKSSDSEETIPQWARPDSEAPPPWAQDEDKEKPLQQSFAIPFYVYLLASAVTAIAAIGSIFEYINQRPVFGILSSDSIFYAPLLGFFAFTGIPTSAFLWFKSVQAANKEAEEQDERDGYL
ncbi:uncharacterized protein LOC131158395 [Malania oleifera]|uniref:uncharacterized protein LOC131158395 n=1 Tax=Malania oleifera TaxID=397392 RepID=UPI0025AE19D2|nr:uncharacterized protein LOC131158395 [Malania oleifera]XP_057969222.1 uncharacterized protein LOC131158395 [Malania oleifera]XP_057969223.1 uncharacterized protein LOC131158395 [Malania oleifera]XP_057969224.1 uncharacterized protein LOC131158395 [Malania oleifera]